VPAPRRALVVDDSPGTRRRLSAMLTLAGWRVVAVAGTDAALHAAVRHRPELVVTAARMRSGDGVALLRRLRATGSRADLVVLTARPDDRLHAAVDALGGACLSSPVDARQLLELLRGRPRGPAAQELDELPGLHRRAQAGAAERGDLGVQAGVGPRGQHEELGPATVPPQPAQQGDAVG